MPPYRRTDRVTIFVLKSFVARWNLMEPYGPEYIWNTFETFKLKAFRGIHRPRILSFSQTQLNAVEVECTMASRMARDSAAIRHAAWHSMSDRSDTFRTFRTQTIKQLNITTQSDRMDHKIGP